MENVRKCVWWYLCMVFCCWIGIENNRVLFLTCFYREGIYSLCVFLCVGTLINTYWLNFTTIVTAIFIFIFRIVFVIYWKIVCVCFLCWVLSESVFISYLYKDLLFLLKLFVYILNIPFDCWARCQYVWDFTPCSSYNL